MTLWAKSNSVDLKSHTTALLDFHGLELSVTVKHTLIHADINIRIVV